MLPFFKTNILLIQPPVMKRIKVEDETILNYFEAISKKSTYLGDSPFEPNIGLLSIAAIAREHLKDKNKQFDITVLDLNWIEKKIRKNEDRMISEEDIKNKIEKFTNLQIIGLSFMTSTYGLWGEKLIKICRELNPSALIFLGGIHPSVRYKEIYEKMEKNMIDGIIVGEGENVFCDILDIFENNIGIENRKNKLAEHKNIYTGGDNKKDRARLRDLSKLPPIAYDLMQPNDEKIALRLYSTRGCSNNCTFCSVGSFHKNTHLKSIVSYKNIKNVIDNLITNIEMINKFSEVTHIVIGDLSFGCNKNETRIFLTELSKITKEYNLKLWCQTRADYIDNELVYLLKKANCIQIAIGCEGATNNQLKKINKGEKIERIVQALRIIKEANIEIQGYWIIGLPEDSKDCILATKNKILEFLDKGYNTIPHITILVPYPNTVIGKENEKNEISGIKIISENWSDYWMNCDTFGCGKPVYDTLDSEGRVLLKSNEIYELWLDTLKAVTEKLNFTKTMGVSNES